MHPSSHASTVVLALAATVALAVIAAHPRVRAWEERLGLSVLAAAGIPFLAIGALYAEAGVLTRDVLQDLRPLFELALGWIGFVVGTRFQVRELERVPEALPTAVALTSVPPMLLCVAFAWPVLAALGVTEGTGLVRDLLVLCACAAASAPAGRAAGLLVRSITDVDEVVSMAVLGLVTVWFRPDGTLTRWQLPPSAWTLVILGLGTFLGALAYGLRRSTSNPGERLALLGGSIALAAGAAGYLALSVPVVCAVAGATLVNLPVRDPDALRASLADLERPLYLVLLVVVGASWNLLTWQGLLLALVYTAGRTAGKTLGVGLVRQAAIDLPRDGRTVGDLLPQSPIAVVVIVASATSWYGDPPPAAHWAATAVVLGSVLSELAARLGRRVP